MRKDFFHHTRAERALTTLCLNGVSYGVEGKNILCDISLDIAANRIGVVGRNGSGKSTLARMLAGLVTPELGTVAVNGRDLAKDRKAALSEVGILFQNPDHQIIFPTVDEEIVFGLRQQGMSKDDAEQHCRKTLAQFGKSHWIDVHVTALSQGQKHLLCFMAIAAMEPRIIILDEPLTGLDIPTRMQLRRYLDGYEGGVVHITHDPKDVTDYQVMIWLEQGSVMTTGGTDDVLKAFFEHMQQLGARDDLSDLSG